MRQLLSTVTAVLLFASACGAPAEQATTATATSTTVAVVPTSGPTVTIPDGNSTDLAARPLGVAPPRTIEVLSDPASSFPPDGFDIPAAEFATRIVQLGLDVGTTNEVLVWTVVPAAWTFDAESGRFLGPGDQHLEIYADCAGDCEPKAWAVVAGAEDGPLARTAEAYMALYERRGNAASGGGGFSGDTGYATRSTEFDDYGLFSSAYWHEQAPLMLSCNLFVDRADVGDDNGYRDICPAIVADWSTVVANNPDAEPLDEKSTDSVDDLIVEVAAGGLGDLEDRQTIVLDDDEDFVVEIALPADSEIDVDTFGTEITLAAADSIFSDIEIGARCDGVCAPKDWEAELNAFSGSLGSARARITPDVDRPLESGWILAGPRGDDEYQVNVMLWADEAERFFSCTAELRNDDRSLVPNVLRMCLSAQPQWFD